jgi:hypothetical protein
MSTPVANATMLDLRVGSPRFARVALALGSLAVAFFFATVVAWSLYGSPGYPLDYPVITFFVIATPVLTAAGLITGVLALPTEGLPGRQAAPGGVWLGVFVIVSMIGTVALALIADTGN